MKIRTGFVSNSSSSSFTIDLGHLTPEQREKIWDHLELAKEMDPDNKISPWGYSSFDAWEISECTCPCGLTSIHGFTYMDNFDMHWFLDAIGVNEKCIQWDEDGYR